MIEIVTHGYGGLLGMKEIYYGIRNERSWKAYETFLTGYEPVYRNN